MITILFDPTDIASYHIFLKAKSCPKYRFSGSRSIEIPDEYASLVGMDNRQSPDRNYFPPPWMFDYQRDITALAIKKRKFALFMDCGLGKTPMLLDFARHAAECRPGKCVLIVSPLMVVRQTMKEAIKFYGEGKYPIQQIRAAQLNEWLANGSGIGITNYESITDELKPGKLAGMILDESSMLKSHYGKWGTKIIQLGKGLEWKLCCTGTPAPNDRIEYANHAVFLDAFPTVNAFLARYFVNRGQTDNRWELKPHALKPFYLSLSHWSMFVTNPATYGWKDNVQNIPPIKIHIHDVELTHEQREIVQDLRGELFISASGGIMTRSTLGQISKGSHNGKRITTNKPAFIRSLVESFGKESTIIWCLYNSEQDIMDETFPEAGSIRGETPYEKRQEIIDRFQSGELKIIISKPKVLGFGLNLQIATRQVFSGLQDSYESFYQAVKRSNRYGSTVPLNVHIPITEAEAPMVETVLQKSRRVQSDTEEQERIFKEASENVAI